LPNISRATPLLPPKPDKHGNTIMLFEMAKTGDAGFCLFSAECRMKKRLRTGQPNVAIRVRSSTMFVTV
jgi:hypothetical protein